MINGEEERMEVVAAAELERWRSYFLKAGADIWTVIQQAITVGAIDFPTDFRERRGEIAETLFARNLVALHSSKLVSSGKHDTGVGHQPVPKRCINDHGNGDAARVNKSVIHTNNADGGHANHHQERKTPLNEEGKRVLLIKDVNDIKASITTGDQAENVVVEALQRLQCLKVTVGALKATEIGKQIKNLKRHPAKRVRALAKELMRDWKRVVDQWANNAMDGTTAVWEAGSGNHSDGQVKGTGMAIPSINEEILIEQAEAPPMDLSKLFSFMDDELCIEEKDGLQHPASVEPSMKDSSNYLSRSLSGSILTDSSDFDTKASTNHLWGHPTPEERGSVTRDVYPLYSNVDKQTSVLIGLNVQRKKVDGVTDKGWELKSSRVTSAVVNTGRSCIELERRRKPVSGGKQVNGLGAVHQTHNVQKKCEKNEVEKLETVKRKIHQGYQQAGNAKKQRTGQVVNFQGSVKAGQPAKGKVNLPAQNTAVPF